MKKLNCVLLIDDDEPTNFIHKRIVTKWDGAEEVQIAEGGQEALNYLSSSEAGEYPQPDIIFLDINMPGMDGWEFLEEYDQLPLAQKGGVMVMMLTTSLNPDDREKAKKYGAVAGFMNKPLTTTMLDDVRQEHFPDYC